MDEIPSSYCAKIVGHGSHKARNPSLADPGVPRYVSTKLRAPGRLCRAFPFRQKIQQAITASENLPRVRKPQQAIPKARTHHSHGGAQIQQLPLLESGICIIKPSRSRSIRWIESPIPSPKHQP